MACIIIDLHAEGGKGIPGETLVKIAELAHSAVKIVMSPDVGSSYLHVLDDSADRYIVEASDWAQRYDSEPEYEGLTDEQYDRFVTTLEEEVPRVVNAISDTEFKYGLDLLREIAKED